MKRNILALIQLADNRQCLIKRATGTDDMADMPVVEITFCKDFEVIFFEGKITLPYKTEDQRDEMFDKLCNETPETLTKWYNDVLDSSGMAELVKELEESIEQETPNAGNGDTKTN